jgi:hypothetical protein
MMRHFWISDDREPVTSTYLYMSTHNPSSRFQNAASYLSNAQSLLNVSTPIKLEVYIYFKLIETFTPNNGPLNSYMAYSNM